jgi:hypothetical protein
MLLTFVRRTVAVCLILFCAALVSCSGGDSAKQRADTASATATGAGSGNTSQAVQRASPGTPPRPAEPRVENGPGAIVPRTYPSLPGAIVAAPDWLINDAPFDAVQYFTAPPDNAAPFYLDALFEFSPEDMMPCLSKEGVAHHGRIRKARAERTNQIAAAIEKDPQAVDPATIDAFLAEFANGFQLLASAEQRRYCKFEQGIGLAAQLPHLQAARQVGRLVVLRASRDLARGDVDQAIQGVEVLMRLSRDLRRRGCAVNELVSMVLDGQAYREIIPSILAAPGITTARCDRLLAALREHEAGSDLVLEMLQGEYVSFRWLLRPEAVKYLHQLAADPQSASFFGGGTTARDLADLADCAAKMTPADIQNQTRAVNTWYRSLEAISSAPRQQRDQTVPRIVAQTIRSNSRAFSGRYPLLTLFMPAVESFFAALDRERAFHRGTQCLIALRRWQLEHDAPPSDLATVVLAAGMAAVPIDPYSDEPLKTADVNGQKVVYSIGADGRDDGGLIEWNLSVRPPKGDLIFRLPPLPQGIPSRKPAARTWTDRTGKFKIMAELVEFKDGAVRLKKGDGKVLTLPVEKLSDADQAYLREHAP